jgi:thiopurine S-methyltransferase
VDTDFWAQRWREGRIGFHEGRPNSFLERHGARLTAGRASRRVLVPLCGKAEDLAYLASLGHQVVGVEMVEQAVRAFFEEHGLSPHVTAGAHGTAWTAGGVTILCADVFACTVADVGPVNAFYDRAALIAFPAPLRPRYVRHLRALLAPGSEGIVVTLEYPPEAIQGPPFSVDESELREHYAGAAVESLGTKTPVDNARLRDLGDAAVERCFGVTLPA